MDSIPVRYLQARQDEPYYTESFNIHKLQHLMEGKDMVQALHRHDFYYLLLLQNAKGKHEIDFTTYEMGDHALYFMRPGQVHQLQLGAESNGYMMQFKTDFYRLADKLSYQQLRQASSRNCYHLPISRFEKVWMLLNTIFEEYTLREESYEEVIKAQLRMIMIELVRQQAHHHDADDGKSLYQQERLQEFLDMLETNITKHKSASEYAEMMYLSPYQLNAITKATVGKTTSELLNEHILLEAKRQLLATSNQINQIAYALGFEDVSYFIRFFRKHSEQTPEEFRKNFR